MLKIIVEDLIYRNSFTLSIFPSQHSSASYYTLIVFTYSITYFSQNNAWQSIWQYRQFRDT